MDFVKGVILLFFVDKSFGDLWCLLVFDGWCSGCYGEW